MPGRAANAEEPRDVPYDAGWHLIGGPSGTVVKDADPLYGRLPGQMELERLPVAMPLTGGSGYWAYFGEPGAFSLEPGSTYARLDAAPGSWVLAGNPSGEYEVALAGVDHIVTYGARDGYQEVQTLSPGHGAWVHVIGRHVEIFALSGEGSEMARGYRENVNTLLGNLVVISTEISTILSGRTLGPSQRLEVQAQLSRLREADEQLRAQVPSACLSVAHGHLLIAAGLLDDWSGALRDALSNMESDTGQVGLDVVQEAAAELRLGRTGLMAAECN